MPRPVVLIVDDDILVANSLRRSLSEDFNVLIAHSGEEALALIEEQDVAVILTDQRMPGITGTQLIEKSRELKPDALGILISGYSDITALIDALNLGTFRGYLTKPWDRQSLKKMIADTLQEYQVIFNQKQILSEASAAVVETQKEVSEVRKLMDQLIAQQLSVIFAKEKGNHSQIFYTNNLDEDTTNRIFLDSLGNGLLMLNADGTIRYENPAFRRLLFDHEKPLDALSEVSILEQEWCRNNDVFFDTVKSVLNGEFVLANTTITKADGYLKYYELTATPVPVAEDRYNAIAVLQDRTAEKKTLRYLTALNHTTKVINYRNDLHGILAEHQDILMEALHLDAVLISIVSQTAEIPPIQLWKTKNPLEESQISKENGSLCASIMHQEDLEFPWVIHHVPQAAESYHCLTPLMEYQSAVVAKIRFHQNSNGILVLATEKFRRFTEDDIEFINTMISQLEAALINKEWQTELANQANRDPLTGLYNHRHFMQLASIACEKLIHQTNGNACLLMIDVDDFKLFNDRYGHLTGDKILQKIADILLESTRTTDIVARFGGDEFVIFLNFCDTDIAQKIIERIKHHLWQIEMPGSDNDEPPLKVTVSIGLSAKTQDTLISLEQFIEDADQAMYRDKQGNQP